MTARQGTFFPSIHTGKVKNEIFNNASEKDLVRRVCPLYGLQISKFGAKFSVETLQNYCKISFES